VTTIRDLHATAPARRLEVAAVAGVVAVATLLRLWALEFAQFRADDFALWTLVRSWLERPALLTQGMDSSLGLPNGPFQVYLLLPAVALDSSPLAPYYLVGALNALGVLALWGFARSCWGPRVALAAAALCAVNPVAVVTSRRLLGNDLLAPFTVLLVWSLVELGRHGRRRDHVLAFVWLAACTQVYVVGLAHVAIAIVGLALAARRLRLLWLAVGVAVFALLAGPYLLGAALPRLSSLGALAGGDGTIDATSLDFTLKLVSSEGYQVFAGHTARLVDATTGLPFAASLVAGALFAVGLGACVATVAEAWRGRVAEWTVAPEALVALTAVLPALLLLRHATSVYVLYLVGALPMPYLLAALGASALWRFAGRVYGPARLTGRALAAGGGVFVVATQLSLWPAFVSAIRESWPASDYGVPLHYSLQARDEIVRVADHARAERVLIVGHGERDAVVYGLLRPQLPVATYTEAPGAVVVPDASAERVLIVSSAWDDALSSTLTRELKSRLVGSLRIPGRDPGYELYLAGGADCDRLVAALAPARAAAASFGDDLTLLGYDIAPAVAEGAAEVRLLWRANVTPDDDLSLYIHLIGGAGSSWGQWDGLPLPAPEWRPGDRILQTVKVPVLFGTPPGEYAVEVGAYTRGSEERLPVQEPGKPQSDRLQLGVTTAAGEPLAGARAPGTPVEVTLGAAVRLESFELTPPSPRAGDEVRVTLFWRGVAPAGADYVVFVHLADSSGRPIAQGDGPPAYDGHPTSSWRPGELVRDPHTLSTPRDLPPGRYWLLVGLYDSAGKRLAPSSGEPAPLARLGAWLERRTPYRAGPRADGDRIVLASVDVAGAR